MDYSQKLETIDRSLRIVERGLQLVQQYGGGTEESKKKIRRYAQIRARLITRAVYIIEQELDRQEGGEQS